MALNNDIPVEIEVFGVTYERYALARLFQRLKKRLELHSVLEIPATGAKAAPALYSLGFAMTGCDVTLVDADADGVKIWRDLGLDGKLTTLTADQVEEAMGEGQCWDLCWNFAVLPTEKDTESLIRRMAKASRKWLMFINVNRFNIGFGMHRAVHKLWKIPWSHGDLRFFSPFCTLRFLKNQGLKDPVWGVVDCPPWPDSPGFRDLRLHRMGDRTRKWVCPYVGHVRSGNYPKWITYAHFFEKLPIPDALKLPYSHLYYVIGKVAP